MEKRIIIRGIPKVVDDIKRENRIRERRGDIFFDEYEDIEVQKREVMEREIFLDEKERELLSYAEKLDKREKVLDKREKGKTEK